MQVLFINNDGAGFADHIDIPAGTSISTLFQQKLPHGRAQDYQIRVNRQPTASDYILQPGDRVSITPTKIEGAFRSTESPRSTILIRWSPFTAWRNANRRS